MSLLADLATTALLPTKLSGGKLDDLKVEIASAAAAEKVTTPEELTALLAREALRYRKLAHLLEPSSPLIAALAKALADEKNLAPLLESYAPEKRQAFCQQMVESITNNRRADALGAFALLTDPVAAETLKPVLPASPSPVGVTLSPSKLKEMQEHLFGHDATHPEPAVHIELNALGQQLGHRALSHIFDPKGPVGSLGASEMQKHLPQDDPASVAAFADRWMTLRSVRAGLVADAMALDSAFLQETIAEGEQRRSIPAALPTPTPIVTQPQLQERSGMFASMVQSVKSWFSL